MNVLSEAKIEKFKPLDDVPFLFVDDEDKLNELCDHLESPGVSEIAIDLEAHSDRSF